MNAAQHMGAFGASGSGKTAWVVQQLGRMRPPRLLVWDFKHDPKLVAIGQPVYSLADLVRHAQAPRFQLRYLVNHHGDIHAQFDLFCQLAWAAGNAVVFVDELPEVTKANKAPPAWRRLVNMGREYSDRGQVKRLTIIAAGQRTNETDKSFLGNCDVLHFGRLTNVPEAKGWASAWGIKHTELTLLPDLHWIEKRASDPAIRRGVLTFPNTAKKAPQTPKASKKQTP